jgi:hypothetical protein
MSGWQSVAALAVIMAATLLAWGFFLDHMEEREKTDREAIAGEEMTERHLIDRQAEIARLEIEKPPTSVFAVQRRVQQVTGSRRRSPRVAIDVEHADEVTGSAKSAESPPATPATDQEGA